MIVVDASAAIELLLNTAAGIRISARLLSSGETLHAPHLIDLEVAQVLRRYARSGELNVGRGAQALTISRTWRSTGIRTTSFFPGSGSFATV